MVVVGGGGQDGSNNGSGLPTRQDHHSRHCEAHTAHAAGSTCDHRNVHLSSGRGAFPAPQPLPHGLCVNPMPVARWPSALARLPLRAPPTHRVERRVLCAASTATRPRQGAWAHQSAPTTHEEMRRSRGAESRRSRPRLPNGAARGPARPTLLGTERGVVASSDAQARCSSTALRMLLGMCFHESGVGAHAAPHEVPSTT